MTSRTPNEVVGLPASIVFQQIRPPYRRQFFDRLHRELGTRLFCWAGEPARLNAPPRQDDASACILAGTGPRRQLRDFPEILRRLREWRPRTVICEAAIGFPVFWLLVVLRPFLGFRLLAWGHGIDNRDWARNSLGWRFRFLTMALVGTDGMILYSNQRANVMAGHLPDLAITVAPNSLDTETLCRHGRLLDKQEPDTQSPTFRMVFLGRLIRGKRLELALKALQDCPFRDWEFRIIGDGPERDTLTRLAAEDPRVRFLGEIQDNTRIGEEMHRAHLMLHPGNLGLVVLHAYSYACPILSCVNGVDGIEHGPEYELLDEENSVLCPADPASLRDALQRLATDRQHLRELGANGRILVEQTRGLGTMINSFAKAMGVTSIPVDARP